MLRPYPTARRRRRRLFLGLLRRREADDLDARAVRDVHGLHHVDILAVRRRLDEQQLGRTLVVDLVKRLVKLAELLRLAVIAYDPSGRNSSTIWAWFCALLL